MAILFRINLIWIILLSADVSVSQQLVNPNGDAQLIARACELATAREFKKAEDLLHDVLTRNPSDSHALYQLAVILSWDGKYDESILNFLKLLELEPDNINLHMEIGRILLWKADRNNDITSRQAAIEEFQTVLRARPDDCPAAKAIGATELKLKHFIAARNTLEAVTALCPEDPEARRLLAQAHAELEDYDRAIQILSDLVEKEPLNPDLRWLTAEYAVRSGNFDEAKNQYLNILGQYPYHVESLVRLGRIHMWQGHLNLAKKYLSLAERIGKKRPEVDLALADLQFRRSHYQRAIDYLQNALIHNPSIGDARKSLNLAQWKAGPGLLSTYRRFDASPGLDYQILGGGAWWVPLDIGTFELTYEQWRFTEGNGPELERDDYKIKIARPLQDWLRFETSVSYADFGRSPEKNGGQLGWSFAFRAMPWASLGLSGEVAREPMSESFATIDNNYYSNMISSGADITVADWLVFSTAGSYAWRKGSYVLGYWNQYHEEWVEMATLDDFSKQKWAEIAGQVRLLDIPAIYLRANASIQETIRGENLPYWAPKSFREEQLTMTINYNFGKGSIATVSSSGSHVHEGEEWGFGGSAEITWRLWNHLELSAFGSYVKTGTVVPWNGKSFGGTIRLR